MKQIRLLSAERIDAEMTKIKTCMSRILTL